MDWTKLFFSFDGRIRRQEFWIVWLALLGVGVLLGWFPLVWPVILYCGVCIRAKRLHDIGRSGWWQLIPWAGYTLATVFSLYYGLGALLTGLNFSELKESLAVGGLVFGGLTVVFIWFAACLAHLGFLLWVGITPGDPDENRFGEPPVTLDSTHIARA